MKFSKAYLGFMIWAGIACAAAHPAIAECLGLSSETENAHKNPPDARLTDLLTSQSKDFLKPDAPQDPYSIIYKCVGPFDPFVFTTGMREGPERTIAFQFTDLKSGFVLDTGVYEPRDESFFLYENLESGDLQEVEDFYSFDGVYTQSATNAGVSGGGIITAGYERTEACGMFPTDALWIQHQDGQGQTETYVLMRVTKEPLLFWFRILCEGRDDGLVARFASPAWAHLTILDNRFYLVDHRLPFLINLPTLDQFSVGDATLSYHFLRLEYLAKLFRKAAALVGVEIDSHGDSLSACEQGNLDDCLVAMNILATVSPSEQESLSKALGHVLTELLDDGSKN